MDDAEHVAGLRERGVEGEGAGEFGDGAVEVVLVL